MCAGFGGAQQGGTVGGSPAETAGFAHSPFLQPERPYLLYALQRRLPSPRDGRRRVFLHPFYSVGVESRTDEQAQFFVQNRGKTIPAHQLDALFEKFFRLDEARSTATGGAGLGLAIAKEIVTLHGGSISAHSEQGVTTFTVELPTKKSL